MGQKHFETNQCAQVLETAQNGETAAWAEATSGRDPGSRPMRRRLLNALKSENRQKSNKKTIENCKIYDDS